MLISIFVGGCVLNQSLMPSSLVNWVDFFWLYEGAFHVHSGQTKLSEMFEIYELACGIYGTFAFTNQLHTFVKMVGIFFSSKKREHDYVSD